MLWKNLIAAIVRYADSHPHDAGVQTLKMAAKGANMPLLEYLESSDIRNVDKLRKLAPMAFPKPLRSVTRLHADQNIHGAWRVYVKES
jgi:hypothetical protein